MKFTLMVTEGCNLRCTYCYEGLNKSNRYMNEEVAKYVIEFILNRLKENPEDKGPLYIVFHGGEPLLNFKIVKYLHKYLYKSIDDREIVCDMTTNGTILYEDIENFIEKNLNSFSISLDGTRESHNKNRVFNDGTGSYDIVYRNAKKLLDRGIDVRARMTFNKKNIAYMYESIKELTKLKFKFIVNAIDIYSEWDDRSLEILKKETEKLIDFKRENMHLNISLVDLNFINKEKGDCFGGTYSYCVDAAGYIYPCTFAVGNDEFIIGNVKDKENYLENDKIKKFSNMYLKENKECLGCTRYNYCIGTRCKIVNKLITNKYTQPPVITCYREHLNVEVLKKIGNCI